MTEDERTHRRTMAALDKRTELLSRELLRRDVAAEHGLDPDRLPADADEDQLRTRPNASAPTTSCATARSGHAARSRSATTTSADSGQAGPLRTPTTEPST